MYQVLILVVVDDGLVQQIYSQTLKTKKILILVVVDDGLVLLYPHLRNTKG